MTLQPLHPPITRPAVTRPDWGRAATCAAEEVADSSVEALWRALNYLSAAQLYLADNPRLARPLTTEDVKAEPRGHWGVCPPVNAVLALLGPLTAWRPEGSEVLLLHGAGHAAPSALAHAYLNNTTHLTPDGPGWSAAELRALVAGFPGHHYGSEITPLIPGIHYTGGQLGPALAVAQGMVLDAPHRLVVPLIGDGEMETGANAAAWTARRAFLGQEESHGTVLPVVLANGLRMGGPSVLAGLDHDQLYSYFVGLGYEPFIHDGQDIADLRRVLAEACERLRPLGADGHHPVLVLTMSKGHTGPMAVGRRTIAGTPAVHKTPLINPRNHPAELAVLDSWLNSYRPQELLTEHGRPTELVRQALPGTLTRAPAAQSWPAPQREWADVSAVLRARSSHGSFRVFSPDELASNRLRLNFDDTVPPWGTEILNEELCHGWLQGYTETGRHALLASYEAFAPITTSLLVQHLKHRAVQHTMGEVGRPSINYLLTSLAWRNTYTHQNPGLASSIMELDDPTTRVFTPADAFRAAAVLVQMLSGTDHTNLLITDKHNTTFHPLDTFTDELAAGAATWPHLSHGHGTPDLVLASAGDVPARHLAQAVRAVHAEHPDAIIRYVHVNDLTALGTPADRPHALTNSRFTDLFGERNPVLLATPIRPNPVRGLLASRHQADRFHVLGYRDTGRPTNPDQLLRHCGMTATDLAAAASTLLKEYRR